MLEDPGERSPSGRTSAARSAHIKRGPIFAGLGIGLEVPTLAALFTLFKKTRLALKTQARLEHAHPARPSRSD